MKGDEILDNSKRFIENQKQAIVHPILSRTLSVEQKAADYISAIIGSWGFLFAFLLLILAWVSINTVAIVFKWDPYPFIFLNLFLSLIAAFQAPIILMAQNRQSQKDRIRMEYDYAVNRKSEREIQEIKEKLDNLDKKLSKLR